MQLTDSYELYTSLEKLNLLENSPPMWWPGYGTFEVVVGAILTQNTQWSRVEISLENLRSRDLLDPGPLSQSDHTALMELIRPSGLFKAKASNLIRLSHNLTLEFGDFETFTLDVDRDWLLNQKGIGPETADSILCYACARPAMVVDSYTARLLNAFGYEFESYDDMSEWCEAGLRAVLAEEELHEAFVRFHGMIVEYVKRNSKGKKISYEGLNTLL